MYNELISYTFDAEEWDYEGNHLDFAEFEYPDCLSEMVYGDVAFTDEQDHAKCLHLSEVELGFLAIQLAFQLTRLETGAITKATIASIHQHFEIFIALAGKQCTIGLVEEPEKQISMHLQTLQSQLRNFRNNLWIDMNNHYPSLQQIQDYETMEGEFIQ